MKQKIYYLGLDAHSTASQLAVISQEGEVIHCKNYRTGAPDLIAGVSAVPGRKTLVVEESQMADWVKRTLSPYVDELIIADPKVNSWIAKSQHMDDKIASTRLAKLLQGGYIKPVYHGDSRRQQFKELVLHYHDLTRQIVRFKNKTKGEFISQAIRIKGAQVYDSTLFPSFAAKLSKTSALQARNYFDILEHLTSLRNNVLQEIRSYYSVYPEINQLRMIPAIGQVTAFTLSAIIDTPFRFSNKRKLWSYLSLAKQQKISNGKTYSSGPSVMGHRLLKYLLIQAAMRIMRSKNDSVFKQTAVRLEQKGLSKKNIHRAVARQLASVIFKLWKSKESYRPNLNS